MLFRAEDLNTGLFEANNILSEAAYIGSPIMALNTVSVVEDTTLGKGVVRFAEIEALSEETGADYIDIISALSESNGLHPDDLVVAVDEAEIILDPSIVTELANVVVNPISENSLAYRFCEECIEGWLESGNENFLDVIINEKSLTDYLGDANQAIGNTIGNIGSTIRRYTSADAYKEMRDQNTENNFQNSRDSRRAHEIAKNPGDDSFGAEQDIKDIVSGMNERDRQTASNQKAMKWNERIRGAGNFLNKHKGKLAIAAGIGAAAYGAYKNRNKIKGLIGKGSPVDASKVMKEADKNGPRWISRKIASLRNMYAQWLQKAKAESDSGKANIFKQIAAKIMSVIDALMKKLQSMTA